MKGGREGERKEGKDGKMEGGRNGVNVHIKERGSKIIWKSPRSRK